MATDSVPRSWHACSGQRTTRVTRRFRLWHACSGAADVLMTSGLKSQNIRANWAWPNWVKIKQKNRKKKLHSKSHGPSCTDLPKHDQSSSSALKSGRDDQLRFSSDQTWMMTIIQDHLLGPIPPSIISHESWITIIKCLTYSVIGESSRIDLEYFRIIQNVL